MKQSNVIKGTLAVVALVAALVVGVAVHMHSVGSPTAGHSTQNTAKTATETTAKTAESITADYPGYSSVDKSGIVRRETSTTLLNEAKASGTAEFLLLLNEYDVVYNAINPISGVLGVDTDGHVTALKSSGESGGIGESLKEYTNAVS